MRGDLNSDAIEIDVRVTNTGDMAGKEVVQIYATPEYYEGGIEKAYVDLVGFEKTGLLAPAGQEGSEQVVTVTVDPYEIASYDWNDANGDGKTGYILEHGKYELKLMDNSHDLVAVAATFELNDDIYIENDPVTGTAITNLFDDVAGQEETEPVQYLSRADFAATFPVRDNIGDNTGRAASAAVQAAADKNNIVYESDENAETIVTGKENGLRLFTLKDGTFATQAQLEGDLQAGEEIVLNEELFMQLYADDDSPLWDELLDQLTFDEMLGLVTESQFGTKAVESIGLIATNHTDGPQGISSFSTDGGKGINYPVQEYIAQTWNKEIAAKQGTLFGREARIGGVAGMYAPAANIHRTPYCGRNFEYYSEDGYLSGMMASNVIYSAREQGIFMYMKHFALNDQEQFRGENTTSLMTWSNEQAIREIYVKPFEIAVKQGRATAIMTSFNRIGATWTGASKALLTDLLRNEWGFKGSTITDLHMDFGFALPGGMNMDEWWMNGEQGIRAGQDSWLVMAGVGNRPSLDTSDPTTQNAMRESVKHIIYTVAQSNVSPNVLEPTWFYIALPIDIVVGLAIVGYAVFMVVKARKNKNKTA